MSSEQIVFLLICVLILWFVLHLGRRIVRFGSFAGAMFRARILRLVGEAEAQRQELTRLRLKVYVIGTPAERAVGLEWTAKGLANSSSYASFSSEQARRLVPLLQEACETNP